jgi:hypothetical protein
MSPTSYIVSCIYVEREWELVTCSADKRKLGGESRSKIHAYTLTLSNSEVSMQQVRQCVFILPNRFEKYCYVVNLVY